MNFGFVDNNPGWQYPQISGDVAGNNGGGSGIATAIIGAAGQITSSIINARSTADAMKYSSLGSNGFLYTQAGVPGRPGTVATIGSTTLILIAVAAIVVIFLFTRK